jgi:ATP-dependent Clp protease ATP-binding subunit ClpC
VDDLAAMYLEWAVNRGMRLEELGGGGGGAARTFAVSGLGAGAILEPEAGLHVRELPRAAEGGARVERASALVELAPMAPGTGEPLLPAAERALAHTQPRTRVVRRYRDEPNPLVRDAARGYRTGRLARVLAGDFDLF